MMLHANRFLPRYPSAPQGRRCWWQGAITEVWMTITTYLADFDADLETKRVLEVALERTRVSLGLVDKFADGIIARRIVELAGTGERNPALLSEGAIEKLRGHLYGD
jgi:hypothetical protein